MSYDRKSLSVRIDPNDGKYYVYHTNPDGKVTQVSSQGHRYQTQASDELKSLLRSDRV